MFLNISENQKQKIQLIVKLYKKKLFNEALTIVKSIIQENPNISIVYNLGGIININLEKYDDALLFFSKAINLNPNFAEANNNMGATLKSIGRFKDSIKYFKNAIKNNSAYANAFNNLGSALNELGEWDAAINNYNIALKIIPSHNEAYNNLIKLLTFYDPGASNLNQIVKINSLLLSNKFNFNQNKLIQDSEIINFFKKLKKIISDSLDNNNFNLSQIYRRNTIDLNCTRHFKVFNSFNVIPKYCFSCYKIQVEPKNITDLLKLYIVFDKLNLKNNNTRKCFTELRPNINGVYKGLIYCTGIEEAEKIVKEISPIIETTINSKTKILIKRGCSEFEASYPEFKKTNNLMKYNKEWKEKEEIIDSELKYKKKEKIFKDSLFGTTINDVLIMQNWLMYAKKVGDLNYRKFDDKTIISNYMENELSSQLFHRKKEFIKISSN